MKPGHQDCLCSRGGCEKRPSGLVTQTSLTPSWVGTFQRLCLFLELAPGLEHGIAGKGVEEA